MNDAAEMEECITVRVPRGTSLALERAAMTPTRVRAGLLGACS